jgi:molybdopterin/thiamine biosynthesis adenylyltransferase
MHLELEEKKRYSRHIMLPEVGFEGQLKLKSAKVLLIGVGGLGSSVSLYLAAAGVGTLGLVDFDLVDISNLQRQILFRSDDIGKSKVHLAKEHLKDLNSHVEVQIFSCRVSLNNARQLISQFDLVIDGSDNFETRYLVNDACVFEGKPLIYGSIYRFEGQVTFFDTTNGPCYRCLFPIPQSGGIAPNCAEAGVMGVLSGIIGTIQANEAIKWILGVGELLVGRLLMLDTLKMHFRELMILANPECPLCGVS